MPAADICHHDRCFYCGSKRVDAFDHMQPRSRGGSNHPSNLVPVCRRCNSQKGSKTLEEYRETMRIEHGKEYPALINDRYTFHHEDCYQ